MAYRVNSRKLHNDGDFKGESIFTLCFIEGGCEGAKGRNTLIFSDGREESLPGKTKVHVKGLVSNCYS